MITMDIQETRHNNEKVGLKNIILKSEYNTDDDDIIADLYRPCLENSDNYDRAVGYFRANIYQELGEDLLNFVIKGGKVRIVCSPHIPEPDEMAAREGYTLRGTRSSNEVQMDLIRILEYMSNHPKDLDCLEMLRLLIEKGSLELYVAVRPGGIYHRKIGMFSDKHGNKIVFSGSGNETLPAIGAIEDWVNDEDFDVYRNWGNTFEVYKAGIKEQHLINLLSGRSGRTKVRPLNEIEQEYLNRFRSYNNFEDCRSGARERTLFFKKETKESRITPYFFQKEAIDAWKKAGMVGMLSMATATGKTYTALFAIEQLLKQGKPILIVVPTTILLNQWHKNISTIYPNVPVFLAGGKHNWRSQANKRIFISDLKISRIILSTMATAASNDFLEFLGQANNLVLIADEAHRLGSPTYRKILNLNYFAKLGLSATPERLFDTEGSEALINAFGEKHVYYLPIESRVRLSIDNEKEVPILGHFLSRYNYCFYTVHLEKNEQEKWDELTSKISRLYAQFKSRESRNDETETDSGIKLLLIQRARIIKKAQNKINVISGIIRERYPSNGRWIVYCEDEIQLNSVISILRKEHQQKVILKYHSMMHQSDRDNSIKYFVNNPSIIVSIRCLDEGVDVPQADGAIILASSSNPRQYIQRRGRVLRKGINKEKSSIIDVLVLPTYTELDTHHSIVKGELARAWNFAQNAMNRDVTHELWKICVNYNVDIEIDAKNGIEDVDLEG